MKKWFELERVHFSLELRTRMAYRTDFFLSFAAMFLSQTAVPVYIVLLYGVSAGFGDWTLADMLLLTGYIQLAHGIAAVFLGSMLSKTIEHVRKGTFDTLLLAPRNSLSYLINRSGEVEDTGILVAGILIFGIGVYTTQLGIMQLIFLLAYLPLAVAFFAALMIIFTSITIRYIDTFRLYELIDILTRFAQFPLIIYPSLLATLFLTLIPVAALSYAPTGLVLGLTQPALLLSGLASIAFFAGAVWYWHNTLKHYTSAGG